MYKEKTAATCKLAELYQQLVITHAETEKQLQKARARLHKVGSASVASGAASDAAAGRQPASSEGGNALPERTPSLGGGVSSSLQPAGGEDCVLLQVQEIKQQLQAEQERARESARLLQEERLRSEEVTRKLNDEQARVRQMELELHEERERLSALQSATVPENESLAVQSLRQELERSQSELDAARVVQRELQAKAEAQEAERQRLMHQLQASQKACQVQSASAQATDQVRLARWEEEGRRLRQALDAAKAEARAVAGRAEADRRKAEQRLMASDAECATAREEARKAEQARAGAERELEALSATVESLRVGFVFGACAQTHLC